MTLAARNFPYDVEAYIILDTGSEYYFWPEWSTEPQSVTFRMPLGQFDDISLLNFTWPDIPASGNPLTFMAVLVNPETGDLMTPVSQSTAYY